MTARGRELFYNPFWPLHAAQALEADPDFERWPPADSWAAKQRADILKAAGKG